MARFRAGGVEIVYPFPLMPFAIFFENHQLECSAQDGLSPEVDNLSRQSAARLVFIMISIPVDSLIPDDPDILPHRRDAPMNPVPESNKTFLQIQRKMARFRAGGVEISDALPGSPFVIIFQDR